jgi:TonB family protein
MNAEAAEPNTGWSFSRWIFFVALALAAHLAFVFLFGTKKFPVVRPPANVPEFHLADDAGELVALTDPTLFALPHWNDASAAVLRDPPEIAPPAFHWTEPPQFLSPAAAGCGAAFRAFMASYVPVGARADFKPPVRTAVPDAKIESLLPQNSTLEISGELAQRRILNIPTPPTLAYNDVIAPSRVQIVAGKDGSVASVILLESSECAAADQKALELARAARFEPSARLAFGEITFHWHTVPDTNAP